MKHYNGNRAKTPFLNSPFKPGDRVNTRQGTGTVYQSGPYNSWVVLDKDWTVYRFYTEFLARIPGRIPDIQAGYPQVKQLEAAGYTVVVIYDRRLPLHEALQRRREAHPSGRIVRFGSGANEYNVVEATREEPEPLVLQGVG